MRGFKIHQGHVLDVLKSMESESVHCVVTSPPYLGLRAYGTDAQVWGGDPSCDHEWRSERTSRPNSSGGFSEKQLSNQGTRDVSDYKDRATYAAFCGCGAWRGELGLEPTPDLFIAHLVSIFREIKRVMRDDALLWLNIGDSYFGDSPTRSSSAGAFSAEWNPADSAGNGGGRRSAARQGSLKPKDLMGIPWRLAFALQDDGWYLRRDIIWHKIAPMPESVYGTRWEKHRVRVEPSERATPGMAHDASQAGVNKPQGARDGPNFKDHSSEYADCPGCSKCGKNDGLILRRGSGRCTTAHEYIFMFSKTADYFYDTDAIAEQSDPRQVEHNLRYAKEYAVHSNGADCRQPGNVNSVGIHARAVITGKRNKRSVWSLSPQAYPEDHFAAFPEDLPEICIKAGTSERGVCAECGASYARVMARTPAEVLSSKSDYGNGAGRNDGGRSMLVGASGTTLGWRRTCECPTAEIVPATVLDPFTGRGTTGVVALRLARSFVGIELKPQYVEMAEKNITNDAPLFNTQDAAGLILR